MRWNNFLEFGPNVPFIASSLHWEQLHNLNRKVMPMAVYPSFAVQLGNCMVFYILYGKKFGGRISVTYWCHFWSCISCSPKTLLALGVSNIQKKKKVMFISTKENLVLFSPSFLFTVGYVEMEPNQQLLNYKKKPGKIAGFGDLFLCNFGIVWQICIFLSTEIFKILNRTRNVMCL